MRTNFLLLALLTSSAFAGEPIKLCLAQPNGVEAKNWKIQAALAHKIEALALAKQISLTSPLLDSNDEKHAKSEGHDKSCSYVLLTTIEKNNQQFSGTFNPSPTGPPAAAISSPIAQAAVAPQVRYKIITMDGKKIGSSTVTMALKPNPVAADFEEAGRKLVDTVAEQAIGTLPK